MNIKKQEYLKILKHIAGQKFTWLASIMVVLTITAFNTRPDEGISAGNNENTAAFVKTPEYITGSAKTASPTILDKVSVAPETDEPSALSKKLVDYAQSLLGRPYSWGSASLKKGFDCSGFVYHVFSKFDFDLERSSRAQSKQGNTVTPEKVMQGDLLFFTGTNPKIRKVGHVGIVISEPGEPVQFVHSSSNGGVKISELEGYYNTRFMFAKRVDN